MTLHITIIDELHKTHSKIRTNCPIILDYPMKEVGIYISPWQIYKIEYEICPAPRKKLCPFKGRCGKLNRFTIVRGDFHFFSMGVIYYRPHSKLNYMENISKLSIEEMLKYFEGKPEGKNAKKRKPKKFRTIKHY